MPAGKWFHNPLEKQGISGLQVLAFIALLALLAAYYTFFSPSATTHDLTVAVYAGGQKLDGATVRVYDESNNQLAVGTTKNGMVSFKNLPQRVVLRASAEGRVATSDSQEYLVHIDLSTIRTAEVKLFTPGTAPGSPGSYKGTLTLSIVDSITGESLSQAAVLAVVGTNALRLTTDASGRAVIPAPYGALVKLRLSKEGYRANSLSISAVTAGQSVSLESLTPGAKKGTLSFTSRTGTALAFNSILKVRDSSGQFLQSGRIRVFDSTGSELNPATLTAGSAKLDRLDDGTLLIAEDATGGVISQGVIEVHSASGALLFQFVITDGVAHATTQSADSLQVIVVDATGASAEALVSAYEADSGKLIAQVKTTAGMAILSGLPIGANIGITARAPGFVQRQPVLTVFGSSPSVKVVLDTADSTPTTFQAYGNDGAPTQASWLVFTQGDETIPFEQFTSDAQGAQVALPSSGNFVAYAYKSSTLTVRAGPFAAGDSVFATLPTAPLTGTVKYQTCVEHNGERGCTDLTASPSDYSSLSVSVKDGDGAPLANALVSIRRTDGSFTVPPALTGANGGASFTAVPAGNLAATAVFGAFKSTKQFTSTPPSTSLDLTVDSNYANAVVEAIDAGSQQPLTGAHVKAEGNGFADECSAPCTLRVKPSDVTFTTTAGGYMDSTDHTTFAVGETKSLQIFLVPGFSSTGLDAAAYYNGAFDEFGNSAKFLSPDREYSIWFSLAAQDASEAGMTLRVGDGQSVSTDTAGIKDFDAGDALIIKSTTFNPSSTCVDANNNAPVDGLFKWVSATVSADSSGSVSQVVVFQVFVKPTASRGKLSLYYNAFARKDANYAHRPADAILGSAGSSSQKAGCYADSQKLDLDLKPADAGRECIIGRQRVASGTCTPQKPFKCTDGTTSEAAGDCGCPAGKTQSGNSCTAVECPDGTLLGACSQVTPPKACLLSASVPTLQSSTQCGCPTGYRVLNGACARCTTQDCSEVGGACRDSNGRMLGEPNRCASIQPLFCSSAGALSPDATKCGCPPGLEPSADGLTCAPRLQTECVGTGGARLSIGQCDASKPNACVQTTVGPRLQPRAGDCGCPANLVAQGNSCVTQGGGNGGGGTCTDPQTQAQYLSGCITGKAPLYCDGASGTISPNPPACACPQGKVLSKDGLSCIPVPSPTPPPNYGECSTPNKCLPANKPFFCTAQLQQTPLCSSCDSTCGGSTTKACSRSTGFCSDKKCVDPQGNSFEVNSCLSDRSPLRCQLNSENNAVVASNAVQCGCPDGKKPASDGKACVACQNEGCVGELDIKCTTQDGKGHPQGCLSDSYSNAGDGVKRCLPAGTIVFDIPQCGCVGEGYERAADGLSCVQAPAPITPPDLPPDASCPGCTSSDQVRFNPVTGSLESGSGLTSYQFYADPIFPADAMPFAISQPQNGRIVLQAISSDSGTDQCYYYSEAKHALIFDITHSTCPIKAYGNSFYNTVKAKLVTIDSAKLKFSLTNQPSTLELTVNVGFNPADGLTVNPTFLEGPATPQLVFAVNNRQAYFGPRVLRPGSTDIQFPSSGLEVIAWRGPGTLEFREGPGNVPSVASLSYEEIATYFEHTSEMGKRVSSCTSANCCTGSWCTKNAFNQMLNQFKESARLTASQTAFRRGNGEPFKTITGGAGNFQLWTAAGVIEGAKHIANQGGAPEKQTPAAEYCVADNPRIYAVSAYSADGSDWGAESSVAILREYDYVGGTCGDSSQFISDPRLADGGVRTQPLCNFIYGDGSCVKRTETNNLASNTQASDEHSKPLQIDSAFIGMPPKFLGPIGMVASYFNTFTGGGIFGNSVEGQQIEGLLTPLLFYQPVQCKIPLNAAYKAKQGTTDSLCRKPTWVQSTGSVTGTGVESTEICSAAGCYCMVPTSCSATATYAYTVTNTQKIVNSLRICENAGGTGILKCKAAMEADAASEITSGETSIDAAERLCESQCPPGELPGSPVCSLCTAPADCAAKCRLTADLAKGQLNTGVTACKTAANAEITSGNTCELATGNLKDLPLAFPISRSAWAACYAYSDGCSPVCQPKKAYLQMIPYKNQLIIINHYGLAPDCTPIAPTLFGSFANIFHIPVGNNMGQNMLYGQLAGFAGQSSFGSGMHGSMFLTGVSWFSAIQTILTDRSCPAPTTKPPGAARYSLNTCPATPAENNPRAPTKTKPADCPNGAVATILGDIICQ